MPSEGKLCALKSHQASLSNRVEMRCNDCGKRCKSARGMSLHLKRFCNAHPNHTCVTCGLGFSSTAIFLKHSCEDGVKKGRAGLLSLEDEARRESTMQHLMSSKYVFETVVTAANPTIKSMKSCRPELKTLPVVTSPKDLPLKYMIKHRARQLELTTDASKRKGQILDSIIIHFLGITASR